MDAALPSSSGSGDVIGRFARGDKLDTDDGNVEALLRRAMVAHSSSPQLDAQLLAAHAQTQQELQRERTCKICRQKYIEAENVGRWRCSMHYAHWDVSNERWMCCMRRPYTAEGCIRCDHTDSVRDVLDAVCVPLFLQPLICKPVAQALVASLQQQQDERLDSTKVRRLAVEEFAATELYASYAAQRQVVLLRTDYVFVLEKLKELRRKCHASVV